MAITALDGWMQHIVGPMLLWCLIAAPVAIFGYLTASVLNMQYPPVVVQGYLALSVMAMVIVGGTVAYLNFGFGGDA